MSVPNLGGVTAGSEVDPCCCEPADCCMYPWPGVDFALYPHSDLTETLYSFGTPETGFHKVAPYTIPTLFGYDVTICYQADSDSGTCIGFTTPSGEDGQWVYLTDYTSYGDIYETIGSCLITLPDSGTTQDEFEPTYTFTMFGDSLDLDRDSLCVWSGLDSRGATWQLNYSNEPDGPEWYITAYPHDGESVYNFSGQLVEAGSGDPAGLYRDTYAEEGTLS